MTFFSDNCIHTYRSGMTTTKKRNFIERSSMRDSLGHGSRRRIQCRQGRNQRDSGIFGEFKMIDREQEAYRTAISGTIQSIYFAAQMF